MSARKPDHLQLAGAGSEHERIGKILRDAFDAAVVERNAASEAFEEVLHEIPRWPPHPDGAQQIRNASSALSVAREKMSVAMIRLREFENLGIIPEDLKRKPAQKESGSSRSQRPICFKVEKPGRYIQSEGRGSP
jgi:hypothetical protein